MVATRLWNDSGCSMQMATPIVASMMVLEASTLQNFTCTGMASSGHQILDAGCAVDQHKVHTDQVRQSCVAVPQWVTQMSALLWR